MKAIKAFVFIFIILAFLSCKNRAERAHTLWSEGKRREAISELLAELQENPNNKRAKAALSKYRNAIDDDVYWNETDKAKTLGAYHEYLDVFPQGNHVKDCRERYNDLISSFFANKPGVDIGGKKERYKEDFWNRFHSDMGNLFDGNNIREALSLPNKDLPYLEKSLGVKFDSENRSGIEAFIYSRAREKDTIKAYGFYLREYPAGRYRSEANDRISVLADDDGLYSSMEKTELNLICFLCDYPAHRRYSDAQKALSSKMGDWQKGMSIAAALEFSNWKPENNKEQILFWVAKKDRMNLFHNWAITKEVLFQCIAASPIDRAEMENAVYAFIFLGNEDIDVLQVLKSTLKNHGNVELAEAYLNSGDMVLYKYADEWVRENDRWITPSREGNSPVRWRNEK